MVLQLMWSLGLACVDMFSIRNKKDLHDPGIVTLIVIGDWVGHSLYIFYSPCSDVRIKLKDTKTIEPKLVVNSSLNFLLKWTICSKVRWITCANR
jgi:hypothetical protein